MQVGNRNVETLSASLPLPSAPDRRMPLFYHSLYTDGIHPDARFPRDRYKLIAARFDNADSARHVRVAEAPQASRDEVLLAHEANYVHRFLDNQMAHDERRRIGLRPWTPLLIPRTLHIMGGAIAALKSVSHTGGFAANMAGGTHHSHKSFGSGYCVFNDIAICALLARDEHGYDRVAVLDLDVHQGDGTATILAGEDGIVTISIHGEKNFPFRKATSDHDFPLPSGTNDEGYLSAVHDSLEILKAYSPEILLFQAGVDALEVDTLGKLNVSKDGMRIRNDMVFSFLNRKTPCILFMGGGYSDPISHTVDSFYDLFVAAAKSNSLFEAI